MNKKRLFINLLANFLSFAITLAISFFLTPFLVSSLGKEAYGFYPLANNIISYTTVITVALNSMAARFITIKISENNVREANIYFNSVLFGNIFIILILLIPTNVFIFFVEKSLDIPVKLIFDVKLLFIFVFLQFFIGLISSVFAISTFTSNRIDLSAKRTIESNLIKVVLLLLFFSTLEPKLFYLGIVSLICGVYLLITNVLYKNKFLSDISIDLKLVDFRKIKELLALGSWNSVTQLSNILLTGLNLLIINVYLGAGDMGSYAIVTVFPLIIQQVIVVITSTFFPQMVIQYTKENISSLLNTINLSSKILSLFTSVALSFLLILGDIFFSLWLPSENAYLLHTLTIMLVIPYIGMIGNNTLYNVFSLTNKVKSPSIVLLLTGILNIFFVLFLLKTTNLGIETVILVSSILEFLRNLLFVPIYAAKCLKLRWSTFYNQYLKSISTLFLCIIIFSIVRYFVSIENWYSLIGFTFFIATICFSLNMFLLLSKNELKKLVNLLKSKQLK